LEAGAKGHIIAMVTRIRIYLSRDGLSEMAFFFDKTMMEKSNTPSPIHRKRFLFPNWLKLNSSLTPQIQ
jgi:hypothetical protein